MRPLSFSEAFSLRRSLGHGVLAVRVATGPMWLGGLLMMIGDGCNPGNLADLIPDDDPRDAMLTLPSAADAFVAAAAQRGFDLPNELTGFMVGALLAVVLVAVLVALAMFAFGCWISTGFARMHVGILEREDGTLGPLFSGSDRFFSMVGYKSLAGLLLSAAFLVSVWPGAMVAGYGYVIDREVWMIGGGGLAVLLMVPVVCYVALGTFLGEHAVALDGMRAVPALQRSWQLAAGNRWPMLGFAIVCGLLQLVSTIGLLLCCVGALATMPLTRSLVGFAKTEGYLVFTRGRAEAARFRLWQRAVPGGPQAAAAPDVSAEKARSVATSASAAPAPVSAPTPQAPPPTWQAEPTAPPWQPSAPELPRFEPPPGFGSLAPQPASPSSSAEPSPPDEPKPRGPRPR